jgi:Flp pilus assembly pilin Flp
MMFRLCATWLTRYLKTDEDGVTIVEYAIMLILVTVVIILSSPDFQDNLAKLFSGINSFISSKSDGL